MSSPTPAPTSPTAPYQTGGAWRAGLPILPNSVTSLEQLATRSHLPVPHLNLQVLETGVLPAPANTGVGNLAAKR